LYNTSAWSCVIHQDFCTGCQPGCLEFLQYIRMSARAAWSRVVCSTSWWLFCTCHCAWPSFLIVTGNHGFFCVLHCFPRTSRRCSSSTHTSHGRTTHARMRRRSNLTTCANPWRNGKQRTGQRTMAAGWRATRRRGGLENKQPVQRRVVCFTRESFCLKAWRRSCCWMLC
jgi:hypothetical protein